MGILRFLLAVSVLIAHTSPVFGSSYVGGIIAVKTFYIISGFYMSLVLNEKYVNKNGAYKLFITNRFLKIYPIYWIVLLLSIGLYLIFFFLYPNDHSNLINLFINYANSVNIFAFVFLVIVNLFILGQDTLLFMGLNTTGSFYFVQNFWKTDPQLYSFLAIPQAWTVSLELMFYLIAPFIVRRKLYSIVTIIILSFILKIYCYKIGLKGDPWNYRFFPFEIAFFLIGNICYKAYLWTKQCLSHFEKLYLPLLAIILLVIYFYHQLHLNIFIKEYLFYLLICVMIPLLFLSSKNNKFDGYVGELSYLIYISHMLILMIVQKVNFSFFNELGLTTLIFTVMFSILCKEIITGKIEKFRQKRALPIISPTCTLQEHC